MRIGTYNVLGLTGYPTSESNVALGDSFGETRVEHFSAVFSELDCDVLGLQEGIAARQMQQVAAKMGVELATIPSPVAWPGHLLSRFPLRARREPTSPQPKRGSGVASTGKRDDVGRQPAPSSEHTATA